ncbi:MAG: 30S ribosome-binding factor RbfA [Dehalococcoidia bacterium]|nr:30S ribosome-binding factor RbfA [Dehalococcoidia bacterium]
MNNRRVSRVNELIRGELSEIIQRSLKDPGVSQGMLSITEVMIASDFSYATVYVSHLGSDEERKESLAGLDRATHWLERELYRRLSIKRTPRLVFRHDDSIERGIRISETLQSFEDKQVDEDVEGQEG